MRLPVETHPIDIPQRLREIDPALRVCFNTETQRYEVWGRDVRGPYILTTFDELDARVLAKVRKAYFIARSTGAPYRELLREQAKLDYEAERARQRRLEDIEAGFRDDFKYFGRDLYPGWRADG